MLKFIQPGLATPISDGLGSRWGCLAGNLKALVLIPRGAGSGWVCPPQRGAQLEKNSGTAQDTGQLRKPTDTAVHDLATDLSSFTLLSLPCAPARMAFSPFLERTRPASMGFCDHCPLLRGSPIHLHQENPGGLSGLISICSGAEGSLPTPR